MQKCVFRQKHLLGSCQQTRRRVVPRSWKRWFNDSPKSWSDFGTQYDKVASLVPLYYSKIATSLLFPPDSVARNVTPIHLLDVAGGPGTFLTATHDHFQHSSASFPSQSTITSTDYAAGMVTLAQTNLSKLAWNAVGNPPITYHTVDACDPYSLPDHRYTHLSCMFGMMFFPLRSEALQQLQNKLLPQIGRAIFSTWHYTTFKDLCEEFSCHIYPQVSDNYDRPFPLDIGQDPILLKQELEDAGYQQIQITQHEATFEIDEAVVFQVIIKNPVFIEAFPVLASKAEAELRDLWSSYLTGAGKKWMKVYPFSSMITNNSTASSFSPPKVLRLKHIANIATATASWGH
jgi:ubiquinone/menaquinone biosynthesis C-methylase UbiE